MTHDGVRGWVYKMVCPGYGMSVQHERLLLLKNTTVDKNLGFNEVCKEKHVYVAYNNNLYFGVSEITGEMERHPPNIAPRYLRVNKVIAWEYEIQETFFKSNDITPHWINCNNDWGLPNETTGQWSGAMGMIQRDEADYAIDVFAVTYARSQVAAFSPTHFSPRSWITKFPEKLSPMWNLFGLFTEVFLSMFFYLFRDSYIYWNLCCRDI